MKVSAILHSTCSLAAMSVQNREAAIGQLLSTVAAVREIDVELATKDITARDRAGLTLMSAGPFNVAVPHACTNACKQLVMAIGTSRDGIPWGLSGKAHLVVLLMMPPPARNLYLRVLSRIARLFGTPEFVESLVEAVSSQEMVERLKLAEEPLGELPEDSGSPTFCVLGAGHGGMAMAGHLAINGLKVNLFNRSAERLVPIQARGGIDVVGEIDGFASLNTISSNPAEAITNADILMVVVPATGHRNVAEIVAPHLKDGQIIVLNPGRTGGALVTKISSFNGAASQKTRKYIK